MQISGDEYIFGLFTLRCDQYSNIFGVDGSQCASAEDIALALSNDALHVNSKLVKQYFNAEYYYSNSDFRYAEEVIVVNERLETDYSINLLASV
jgi:hypothetical protein